MTIKCKCGNTAFFYEKTSNRKKTDIYKCGSVDIDSKKNSLKEQLPL